MPIYEFRCPQCDHIFEELVRANDRARVCCPKCGDRKPEPVLSVFATHTTATPIPASPGGCGRCGDPNGPCQA